MKKIKVMIPYLIISIILIVGMLIKVYADYLYSSSDVEYDNSNSSLEANDVQGAIDELYEKAESCASSSSSDCPEGYEKENLDNGFDFKCVFSNKPICKRATTLHTETCSRSSNGCYADGYYASGSKGTTTITYGSLGTSGTLTCGDAFDCDVNGDGTYDAETERFYYVSNYFDTSTKTFDNDYYVFIYYSNTTSGVASTDNVAWYSSSDSTSYGPTTAMAQLPKTTGTNAWRDDLLKTRTRNILKGNGVTTVTGTAKSNFSYEGYAARLLTMQELRSACPNASTSNRSMSDCNYFFEQTIYSKDLYGATRGPWLESAYLSTSAWTLDASGSYVYYSSTSYYSYYGSYGARPVIEVNKSDVSY